MEDEIIKFRRTERNDFVVVQRFSAAVCGGVHGWWW
jgi:hypothetical protein